jgi:DNA repair protein RadC
MSSYNFQSIKSWHEDDRPREKMQLKGRAALSDAELIAILLGSGSKNESAVDLAKRLLQSVKHNLNGLAKLSIEQLTQFKGIGPAKAITIITALELGKRRRMATALEQLKVDHSQKAFDLLQPLLADLPHEEFWVIFLNNSNKLLDYQCISKGGLTGTVADKRMIFTKALNLKSTAIILAHNHPSGKNQPSSSDITLTKDIKKAGDLMDIKVLDHLIIAHDQYYSFADHSTL